MRAWQVHSYERFTPLSIETEGLKRGYLDVQPGDCVVAFSRRDIYDIKQLIEAGTGQRYATRSCLSHSTCTAKHTSILRPRSCLQSAVLFCAWRLGFRDTHRERHLAQ